MCYVVYGPLVCMCYVVHACMVDSSLAESDITLIIDYCSSAQRQIMYGVKVKVCMEGEYHALLVCAVVLNTQTFASVYIYSL